MKALSGKEFCRLLENRVGKCSESKAVTIYGKIGSIVRISVPVHGNQPLKLGLVRHLLKLAGVNGDHL